MKNTVKCEFKENWIQNQIRYENAKIVVDSKNMECRVTNVEKVGFMKDRIPENGNGISQIK